MADNFSQLAKDFIDRANGGTGPTGTWRLEVLQKRLSANADGTPKDREIPVRIRRFLKGIPWAQVHDAIRYLISQSPYKGIIYNGVELKGEYRPTLTQWRRDDQEQVGGNAQGSYTLIQDLIEVTDDGDSLDTVSADSCSETEVTKWVWDAPEIEELPYDGSQGVTYAIRQVRRNEDGTFDYAIVRQVAKTKTSGWIVTECDDYSRVSVKVFDNVYGGLFDGDPFTDGTTVLPIPAPCEADDGTLVQVSVAQNPDCTFRITVQKTEAKLNVEKSSETRKGLRGVVTSETTVATNPLPETGLELGEQVRNELRPDGLYDVTHVTVATEDVGDVGSSCGRTVFEHQHAETRNEASRPEDEADFAGGGKTYQVQSRATEEGTWDVTRTETTEIEQVGAQKTKQKTLRGITETTVDRNVDNADVTVTNVGDRVSVEMTPGGKYNRTVTKVSKESVGDVGSSCETTVFEHRHVESENVASRPEKEADFAGGGKTYQVQARATEEGTWDVSRTTVEEARDVTAQHVMRKTLRGVTETTVTRSTSDSSVSVSEIGDEVRVEQTPGGLWNRTVTHASHEAVGVIGKSCSSTPVVHTDTTVSNVPDGSQPEPFHQTASVNVEKTVETRRTEEGTWDVTERSTVHQQDVITGLKAGSEAAEVEIEIGKNVVEKPTSDTGTVNVETSISASKNDHGSYDYQKRTTTYKPWGERKIAESENDSQRVEFHSFQNLTGVPTMTAGHGQSISASVSRNNVGSYDGSFRVVTGKPYGEEKIASADNDSQTVEFHAFQNLDAPPPMTAGQGESISASVSRNELGLFDGSYRKVVGKPYGEEKIASAENDSQTVEFHAFQNLDAPPPMTAGHGELITASVSRNELGLFDGNYRVTKAKGLPPTMVAEVNNAYRSTQIYQFQNLEKADVPSGGNGQQVTASANRNEFGLFDGKYTIETAQPFDSGWITWDSKTVTASGTYWYHHGLRLFYNQEHPLTDGMRGSNVSVSARMNEFGLFDGQLTYSDLYDWTEGGGSGGGGHVDGEVTVEQVFVDPLGVVWKRNATVRVTKYWGKGNEASEASVAANQTLPQGLSLPERTYANGKITYTEWDRE